MMASQLPSDLKDYLKSIEARLHQFQTECIQTGKPFTMDAIKSFIKAGYTSQGITFQALVDEFLKSLRLKLKAGVEIPMQSDPFKGVNLERILHRPCPRKVFSIIWFSHGRMGGGFI